MSCSCCSWEAYCTAGSTTGTGGGGTPNAPSVPGTAPGAAKSELKLRPGAGAP
eukprot:CAMPEP_0173255920 /NCGR_PEP_ID=MMETSP1142-20121109/22832_1 /TAXON_ID=483371 /ORGANISM="non described non described, Strain CCMP2298" /LENGTH=52 /DNA_ID=CAMNT_0014189691 /DNA_START=817 /DNA_END=975 /DNA_ORIENTATION=+